MTICIAALCRDENNNPAIVGAADRLMSGGGRESERDQPKIYPFRRDCVGLMAGDYGQLGTILLRVREALARRPRAKVGEIADVVAAESVAFRRHCIERAIGKYGLTIQDWTRKTEIRTEVVSDISADIDKTDPDAGFLVAGFGARGTAHLYGVDCGVAIAQDAIGYAAIGCGATVADAQFMDSRYTSYWSISQALWLVYCAKRAAEVIASVGGGTDLFTIRHGRPRRKLKEYEVGVFEKVYRSVVEGQQKAHAKAAEQVAELLRVGVTPRRRGSARKGSKATGPSPPTPASSGQRPSPGSDESRPPAE